MRANLPWPKKRRFSEPVAADQSPSPLSPARFGLCLLAAGLFWLLNALNKDNYAQNIEYPLRVTFNDSLFVPTTPLPRSVRVNVSGDGWRLLGQSWLPFGREAVRYEIKNPLTVSVINTASLAGAVSEQIKNLRVNYVMADTLTLGFDQRIRKTVRLVADSLHIDLAPRMVVSSKINLTPATITLEGPARLLRVFADTLLVKIPGRRIFENYDDELPIYGFRHPAVRVSASRVLVSFEVAELLSQP
jgi:hypothetical protein